MLALCDDALRGEMDRAANFIHRTETADRVINPPMEVVKDVQNLSAFQWGVPSIDCLVEVPTLRSDGSVLMTPGYDRQSGMFFAPADGFLMPALPEEIHQDDIDAAVLTVQEAIGDFPVYDAASRANLFALLLTPVIRPAIRGCVPLALIDAPMAGTGKSLLADVVSLIAIGRRAPMMAYPKDGVEMEKKIGSSLMAGRQMICFDNIEGAVIAPELALALTASDYEMRILGQSKVATVSNRCTWLATGNNIKPGGDMPRRCYQIRLDARSSKPYLKRRFKHPDIRQWVTDNRGELLRALLIIARSWFLGGRPEGNSEILGSFEEWSGFMGGILKHAQIPGFLENFASMVEGDEDALEWERFVDDLGSHWPDGVYFRSKDVTDILRTESQTTLSAPSCFADIDKRKEDSLVKALGKRMSQRKGRRYGDRELYLQGALSETRTSWWRVMSRELDDRPEVVKRKPS